MHFYKKLCNPKHDLLHQLLHFHFNGNWVHLGFKKVVAANRGEVITHNRSESWIKSPINSPVPTKRRQPLFKIVLVLVQTPPRIDKATGILNRAHFVLLILRLDANAIVVPGARDKAKPGHGLPGHWQARSALLEEAVPGEQVPAGALLVSPEVARLLQPAPGHHHHYHPHPHHPQVTPGLASPGRARVDPVAHATVVAVKLQVIADKVCVEVRTPQI